MPMFPTDTLASEGDAGPPPSAHDACPYCGATPAGLRRPYSDWVPVGGEYWVCAGCGRTAEHFPGDRPSRRMVSVHGRYHEVTVTPTPAGTWTVAGTVQDGYEVVHPVSQTAQVPSEALSRWKAAAERMADWP
jgi:hypothetical protein